MAEDPYAVGLAGMAQTGNPRIPMDTSALADLVNASADYASHTIMHPRYSAPADDPAFFPVARPVNVLKSENGGARYGIRVPMDVRVAPEAGPTTANGRIIRGRGTGQSFWGA
jgi:hypothetical protein